MRDLLCNAPNQPESDRYRFNSDAPASQRGYESTARSGQVRLLMQVSWGPIRTARFKSDHHPRYRSSFRRREGISGMVSAGLVLI